MKKIMQILKVNVKAEYLLILIAMSIFFFTIFCKKQSEKKFLALYSQIDNLEMQLSNFSENSWGDILSTITDNLSALSYFNKDVENSMTEVLYSYETNSKNENFKNDFFVSCLQLQNNIRFVQNDLDSGYEQQLTSAIILLLIAVGIIIYKNIQVNNKVLKTKAMNEAQLKFSRDLHDGAAQDLAALKIFLRSEEKDKSLFYAEQAFKEVRYLIDSTHIDTTSGFDEILQQVLTNFENNFNIRTLFYNASSFINSLNSETQMELFHILQEALSNCQRHSNATMFSLKITDVGNSIRFVLSDDGIGFPSDSMNKNDNEKNQTNHYGLKNIRERVAAIDGAVDILSTGGTTIAITVRNSIY